MILKTAADELGTEVGIDPVTVLTFLTAVLPLLIQCWQSPDEAAEYFRQDTKATRRRIRQAARMAWRDFTDSPASDVPPKLLVALQHRLAKIDNATMHAVYAER